MYALTKQVAGSPDSGALNGLRAKFGVRSATCFAVRLFARLAAIPGLGVEVLLIAFAAILAFVYRHPHTLMYVMWDCQANISNLI